MPEVLDIDGDGLRDLSYLLRDGQDEHTWYCLYLTLRGGEISLLVEYDAKKRRLTGSVPISPALRGPVAAELERRVGLSRDDFERLLPGYTLVVNPYLRDLEAVHAQALRLYQARKAAKAARLLEPQLTDSTLMGQADPDGRSPKVTEILNDYGFFLLESGQAYDASIFLRMVIERAPDRAVAYLNLADAEYAADDKAAASGHYRQYTTLMKGAGKGDKTPPRVAQRSQAAGR